MTLVVGTNDGVWTAPESDADATRRELAVGVGPLRVLRVRTFGDTVFAATETGLFESDDGGQTWTDLGVPNEEVYAVAVSPDGERVYAGTHPAAVFVSENGGRDWRELDGFQALPSREEWHAPRHSGARIRSLCVHPDTPTRVVAGVEAGGVHLSDDGGQTWTERKQGVYDDIHHLRMAAPDEFVAATGRGLYRTRDAGRSWTRLDGDGGRSYFRETFGRDGVLYTAATPDPSSAWTGETGAEGVLLESRDGGETFDGPRYPGGPAEVVLAWATDGDRVFAGTDRGRILVRDGEWTQVGRVPTGIRSLTVVR